MKYGSNSDYHNLASLKHPFSVSLHNWSITYQKMKSNISELIIFKEAPPERILKRIFKYSEHFLKRVFNKYRRFAGNYFYVLKDRYNDNYKSNINGRFLFLWIEGKICARWQHDCTIFSCNCNDGISRKNLLYCCKSWRRRCTMEIEWRFLTVKACEASEKSEVMVGNHDVSKQYACLMKAAPW